jgi:hypothetical protein
MELISNTTPRVTRTMIPVAIELPRPANVLSFLFILGQVPLALLLTTHPQVSAIHAYATLGVGVIACIMGRLDIAAAVAAYITGAEVLWRMTHAPIFWEYGKYAALAIFILGILRSGLRNSGLPFLYFGLLVPSSILTVDALSSVDAQRELSFNLSGPLALMGSACFFSGLSFSKKQIGKIFIALLAPIAGIAAIAIYSTFSAGSIYFGDESNQVTSGGYGPNQVSAVLGLGALTAMLSLISIRSTKLLKILVISLGIVLLAQCLLTFSRGGMYMAVGGMLVVAAMLVRQPRKLIPLLAAFVLIGSVLFFWIFPWLNTFTRGSLMTRYKDVGSTGRIQIFEDDIRIWGEHPILGVGPGMAKAYRHLFHKGATAHIEYSRLLSEHGLFGLAAIGMLLAIAIRNIRQANPGVEKAMKASLLFWSLSFMIINAMRLLAPSFLIGLSSTHIEEEDEYIMTEVEIDEEEDAE